MVNFYNNQAHGEAKNVTERAKVQLAEWASKPDATHAALIERSQLVFDPTTDKEVWLETDVSVMFFETLESLEVFVKNKGEEAIEPKRMVRLTKFEWDLGINLIP